MMWLLRTLVAAGLLLAPGSRQAITVMGATSLTAYARAVIEPWARAHANVQVALSGGGSYAGWYAMKAGQADIALCDLRFDPGTAFYERGLGKMPVLFIANPSDGIRNVSRSSLRRVFHGQIKNWRELGGHNQWVRMVVRPVGSGARAVVAQSLGVSADGPAQVVQLSNGAVVRAVQETPGAIGYVEGDHAWPGVIALKVNGQSYQAKPGKWPFYAWPRIYWPVRASSAVISLAHALSQSPRRSSFSLITRVNPP